MKTKKEIEEKLKELIIDKNKESSSTTKKRRNQAINALKWVLDEE